MINIRNATISDSEQLLSLAKKLATSFEVEESGFQSVFTEMLELNHVAVAVAEEDNQLIGYVLGGYRPCFYASGNVAFVEEILVHEDFRTQSIGRRLMAHVEDWAQTKGCRLVSLATRRAAPFYLAIGYKDSATYFKKDLNP